MKNSPLITLGALALLWGAASCNSESTIGQSIVQDKIDVVIDSAFTVSGQSIPTARVQSRTTSQLIGRIDATGFGRMTSDVVTQFMPSSQLDTVGISSADIDSLVMYLFVSNGDFVGDSIVPMGIDVYRLNRNLPSPIFSDFDPGEYYDSNSAPLASTIYNLSRTSGYLYADTVFKGGIEIKLKMPDDLGRELFDSYKANPTNFTTPTAFTNNVFKGVYIKNSFGSGRLMRSTNTIMTMYYHHKYFDQDKQRDTTVYKTGNYFAVTPEIVTNNDISLQISPKVQADIDAGQALVMAPVGLEVQMRFPGPELVASYNASHGDLSVLNTLSFSVQAESYENELDLVMPTYLLMVLSKDKDEFFAKNKLPDKKTSFYATYNTSTQTYDFGEMREFLVGLLDKKGALTEEDYTFTIMPVSCTFETSNSGYYYGQSTKTLTMVTPYMAAPAMARLKLDEAKIKLTYSTQTIQQ